MLARDLNADVKATGLAAQGKNFGDLTLTANTTAGRVNFALNSDLAGAAIQGRGSAQLAANYPLDAQLTFNNLTWARLRNRWEPPTANRPVSTPWRKDRSACAVR